MYVVNYAGGGFVIVGASKDYYPVLAYSEENTFEYNEEIGGLVIWMKETQEAIRQSGSLDTETKNGISNMWKIYEPVVSSISTKIKTKASTEQNNAYFNRRGQIASLGLYSLYTLEEVYDQGMGVFPESQAAYDFYCNLAASVGSPLECTIFGIRYSNTTKVGPLLGNNSWWQGYPFNALCNNYYTGCAPIAMAQIMKFHQYPTSYDWNDMPDDYHDNRYLMWDYPQYHYLYPRPSTPALIQDVGDALGLDYVTGNLNAKDSQIANAFQYFGYSYSSSSNNPTTVINEMVYYNRPVFMGGYINSNGTDGHAWVCDGVQQDVYVTQYFIEFLTGSPGNYHYINLMDAPSIEAPRSVGTPSVTNYFHYNWGEATGNNWFTSFPTGYNYQFFRTNFYVHP